MTETADRVFKILNNNKNKKKIREKAISSKKEHSNTSTIKNKLLNHFGIDNSYTERKHKVRFDKFDDLTYPVEDYNFSADLVFLPSYRGYKYLLVVVDNWSNEIDFEAIKNKEPKTVLKAFKIITDREYLNMPKASLRVDAGTEFKGIFRDYMYDSNILLKVSITARHKQNAKAESAIKLISYVIINYLDVKELETQKTFKNWLEILPSLRETLNSLRYRKSKNPFKGEFQIAMYKTPKFKVGDLVVHILEHPVDPLGKKHRTSNKRVGDIIYSYHNPKKIKKIVFYPNNVRYILEGMKRVSYTEDEILLFKEIDTKTKNIK